MAWTPQKQVLDLTAFVDNLLGYVEEQDADALAWANGGQPLPEFARLYSNASGRLQTMFPSLMVLSQACETDLRGEILQGGLEITLEGTVSGSDPDELVRTARMYATAVESMLHNAPSGTLTAGSNIEHARLMEAETVFDILRGQQQPSAFLQIFQTRCGFLLTQPAY